MAHVTLTYEENWRKLKLNEQQKLKQEEFRQASKAWEVIFWPNPGWNDGLFESSGFLAKQTFQL